MVTTPEFALIGRSFSSALFEPLYQASLVARAERRAASARRDTNRFDRRWNGSGEPVTLPLRLPS